MVESGLGPPIRYLFGLAPTSVEPGGVTFTMPVNIAARSNRRQNGGSRVTAADQP